MVDETRMTVRLPQDAAAYLAEQAREHFTSKNAQIVRAIRAAMKSPAAAATAPGMGSTFTPQEKTNGQRQD